MASDRKSFMSLPDEVLYQIVGYLEPSLVLQLPRVSRRLRHVSMDDELWKRFCYEASPSWRGLQAYPRRFKWTAERGGEARQNDRGWRRPVSNETDDFHGQIVRWQQRSQEMANWNPAFDGEEVSWRDEYKQRHGPASVNWLQVPYQGNQKLKSALEVWGVALYKTNSGSYGTGTLLAVSPLEDGTVCLWNVRGTRGGRGKIWARSRPDILSTKRCEPPMGFGSGIYSGNVSVNNHRHRAFFANEQYVVEVDLNRLDVVSRQSFGRHVVALSTADEDAPLTVGTTKGVHLYDFRDAAQASGDASERLDWARTAGPEESRRLVAYSPLAQPMPLSILHITRQGSAQSASHDFYVGGRFPSILYYDRRRFPAVAGSIYSGAQINSLASLPLSSKVMQDALPQLRADEGETEWAAVGQALIAGGCYNSKGSLEVHYGLSTATEEASHRLHLKPAVKNRQTAASATILSVANHGTKIVFSDGDGNVKWMERDGLTACRQLRIGHGDIAEPSCLFKPTLALDNIACKILSTGTGQGPQEGLDDSILFWTGEKLGMVSFTPEPLFDSGDFKAQVEEERGSHLYMENIGRALGLQADEARFWSRLGTGTGSA